MTKYRLLLVSLMFALVGCVDTFDSVSREFRNTNNEAVDGLMMITSEEQAKMVILRIFKPLGERYKATEGRLKNVVGNRTDVDLARELVETESVHIYLTELEINRQRYALEITRLRNLMKQLTDDRQEMLKAKGEPAGVNPKEAWPSIYEFTHADVLVKPLREQLTSPKLLELLYGLPDKKVAKYDAFFKTFKDKREQYKSKRAIKLVD